MILQRRNYSAASKLGALVSSGGWVRKEALKHAADDKKDYDDKKLGTFLLGSFSPFTSSLALRKAEKMAEEGASPEEIKEMLKKRKKHAYLEAGAHVLTGGVGLGLGQVAATGKGLHTKFGSPKRRKFDKFYEK